MGLRLISPTAIGITYVTGVANTGVGDTTTPVPTMLPTEAYISTMPGAAVNGTKYTG
jgi:hypothetical protein